MADRPNILFIECDSMDGRVMGCMGHPAMKRATPNLDALARRGVLFRNAYSNNPICVPSRASMWSGQFTFHCEGWNNFKGLEEGTPTFRTHLEAAGYATVTFGKTDYLSGHHTVRARVSPWTRSANILRPNYRMGPPRIFEDRSTRLVQGDWQKMDQACEWLRQAAQHPEQPFWLYVGPGMPHPSFRSGPAYLEKIDESGVNVPALDAEDHHCLYYQRVVKNWEHGFTDEMAKRVRHIYFAMISEVDAMVGQVLNVLEDLGLSDSTYVLFTSDHGELAMEHRQFYKMSMYEGSVHVPLIVAGPGVRKGAVVEDLVSLVDIYPTLMDMALLPHPEGLDGHSLMPELRGEPSQRPDWVLSECHDSSCNTGHFMIRRGEWKYIAYPGYDPQLFNLKEDPDELRNLARTHPDQVRKMDRLLRKVVDYEAVDAKVKAYDRASFRQWRAEQKAAGTYEETMSRIFSGFDSTQNFPLIPWSEADERVIEAWLAQDSPTC